MDDTFLEIRKGNIKAFEKIFKEYYQRLCLFCMRYVKDSDTAQELVQDVFYNVWKKRNEISISVSFKSYIYRSVYNKSLQYIQHRNIERKYEQYVQTNSTDMDTNPWETASAQELDDLIKTTFESLPEKTRQIFRMSRVDGLKYQEIADKLSVSVKTVEAYMSKALQMFRVSLKEYLTYN